MRGPALALAVAFLAACGEESDSSAPTTTSISTETEWGPEPAKGKVNLRLLLRVYGKPLAAKDGPEGRFRLALMSEPGGSLSMEEFVPDANGRFICTDLEPGTYTVEVRNANRKFPDWSQKGVTLAADTSPLIRVDLK